MAKTDDMASRLEALRETLGRLRVAPAYRPDKWFVGPLNFAEELRAGMNLPEKVAICDVTLREASQGYFTEREYLTLATALEEAGVAVMQFLSDSSEQAGKAEQIKALRKLGKLGLSAKLQLYGVNSEREMDLAAESGVHNISYEVFAIPEWQPIFAARRTFAGPSELLEKGKAVRSEDDLIEYTEKMAEAIKKRGMQPRPMANFFSLASMDFLRRLARTCEGIGVFALNMVDAAGNMGPTGFRHAVAEMKKAAPGLTIGIHAHDDLGLATANALAGVEAGASHVDVTINGAGARAGNVAMAEIVVALEALYGVQTGIKLDKLTSLSKLFEDTARWPTPKDLPLVGEHAFTDSSETHCFLMQADPLLFAPVRPELVGNKRRSHLVLRSGLSTLRMRLRELGIPLAEEKLPDLLALIKSELLIRRRPLTDEEMRDCVGKIGAA